MAKAAEHGARWLARADRCEGRTMNLANRTCCTHMTTTELHELLATGRAADGDFGEDLSHLTPAKLVVKPFRRSRLKGQTSHGAAGAEGRPTVTTRSGKVGVQKSEEARRRGVGDGSVCDEGDETVADRSSHQWLPARKS
jgi:hypothetical protein